MAYNVSEATAYVVLYGVLTLFSLLALGSMGNVSWMPSFLTLRQDPNDKDSIQHFLAARNSAGTWTIALSFFASGMGAWVLYGTTEMGANPRLSWLGVIGYSLASAVPAIAISFLGPKVREMSDARAFSTTDFGRRRYGRIMQLSIGAVSVFYMFIFIVAELTSISNIFKTLTNNWSTKYGIGIIISLGVFTMVYTTVAGLPASIVTDKFQGVIVATLVIMLTFAVTILPENRVSASEFAKASNIDGQGFKAMVTLILAIMSAELFNQSTWQRVWAAESVPVMRKGFFIGSTMVFFLMMFFGVIGMIAYANDPDAYDSFEKLSFLAFFDLLAPLGDGWHVLVLILVTALAASSVDSLQNGLTSIFYHDLVKIGWNPTWITRGLMVAVNIPAVFLASDGYDVISLFLVADLVCATSALPVFLGLQTQDIGILVAPTELGAFMGCITGIVTVLVTGRLFDAEGGLFEYFWLRNNGICALCGNETMISFIVTPVFSAVGTYLFSALDVAIRGERARSPVIAVRFDEEEDEQPTNEKNPKDFHEAVTGVKNEEETGYDDAETGNADKYAA